MSFFAMVVGLLVTALLTFLAYTHIMNNEKVYFLQQYLEVKAQVLHKMQKSEVLADNISVLFKATDSVDAKEFQVISEDQLARYPYVYSVGLLPRIISSDRRNFEKEMQESGFVTYIIHPNSEKESYFPVKYIEPLTPQNAILLGRDLMSNDEYQPHIRQALETGRMTSQNFGKEKYIITLFKAVFPKRMEEYRESLLEKANFVIVVTVDARKLMQGIKLPDDFRIDWQLRQSSLSAGESNTLLSATTEESNAWIFKFLRAAVSVEFADAGLLLHFTKNVYWYKTDYFILLIALAFGLLLTTLLLMTARNIEFREKDLQLRNAEVKRQVREKTLDLKNSELKLKDAQRIAQIGSWELDLKNNELKWSDEVFRIFEVDAEKFVVSYETFLNAIHPDDREMVSTAYTSALESMEAYDIEHRLLFPDGRIKYVHEYCENIYDSNGIAIVSTGTVQDITAYKNLEGQLRQSQKMEAIGTLVGGIAHDFNNMLAGMTGNLYLAKKKLDEFPDVVKKLDNVTKLSFKAAEMIKQLLIFARKGHVEMATLSLSSFVRDALRLSEGSIPEGIHFHHYFCQDELVVKGDSTQLQQVLMNLLNNARDAVANVEMPEISIKLSQFEADETFMQMHPGVEAHLFAHLEVGDNGVGISAGDQEHIFEPFFTTKSVGEGAGLGLSMTYGVVQSHSGVIDVSSTLGKGTTFHLYLPLFEGQLAQDQHQASGEIEQGNGELILIVDDNMDILESSKEVLVSLDYQVELASDGLEAIEKFTAKQDEISLIIMDIMMPRLGGVIAVERIKSICPTVKVIFASGYDKDDTLKSDMPSSEYTVLSKPYSIALLSQTIRDELDT